MDGLSNDTLKARFYGHRFSGKARYSGKNYYDGTSVFSNSGNFNIVKEKEKKSKRVKEKTVIDHL